jgi:hypothetical protein
MAPKPAESTEFGGFWHGQNPELRDSGIDKSAIYRIGYAPWPRGTDFSLPRGLRGTHHLKPPQRTGWNSGDNPLNDELLSSDGLIRRLKKGSPILLEKETIRLPRFTEIREVESGDIGGSAGETIVLARSRTATWALLPWPKKTGFALKDAKGFLSMLGVLQQQNPAKPVKGYVLAFGPVKDDGAKLLEQEGHLASVIAEV